MTALRPKVVGAAEGRPAPPRHPTERIFADELETFGEGAALYSGSEVLTYRELAAQADGFARRLGPERGLLLLEARNEVPAVVAYIGALRARQPVILVAPDKAGVTGAIADAYRPSAVFRSDGSRWSLNVTPQRVHAHGDLAVLLSTSGSTGSRKFVRLSYGNVDANAESIAEYLGIDGRHVSITALPLSYSYGLSVLNSHLARGAAVVLTGASVVEEAFWSDARARRVTSLAGVPHTFDLLERVGFCGMHLPSLRYVTQAGGRLAPEKVVRFATLARERGWKLFVMYGQTEATARIAYVPPDRLLDHPGCIGIPIPGGALSLRDEQGATILEPDVPGELIYRGPNVMMGYAQGADDLEKGREIDELATGDIACRNGDGLYYLVGRKSRFAKLFGLRINLDDVERALRASGIAAVVTGDDTRIVAAVVDASAPERASRLIGERYDLPPPAIEVVAVSEVPLLPSGKYDYARIRQIASERARCRAAAGAAPPIGQAFGEILGVARVEPDDTFTSLGGDSLAFVQASVEVERRLGHLPGGWATMPVSELEAIAPSRGHGSIEAATVLRALAIIGIVLGHARVLRVSGAALLLLAVAGHNFARFQLHRVAAKGSAWPVLSGISRVVVPTVLIVAVHQASKGRYFPNILLLHANLVDPWLDGGFSYWFIEVIVQIFLVLFLLLLVPGVRRAFAAHPFPSATALALVSIAAASVGPWVWDTEHLYDRVPHMMMWIFALGICAHFAERRWRRWAVSGAFVAATLLLVGPDDMALGWLSMGGLVLVWVREVRVPLRLGRWVGGIASASLYIYLTHFHAMKALRRVVGKELPALEVPFALASGVIVWMVADRLWRRWRLATETARGAAIHDAGGWP